MDRGRRRMKINKTTFGNSKNKPAQIFLNPKTIAYILGGALISYFFFQSTQAAFIGGIIGFIMSFVT